MSTVDHTTDDEHKGDSSLKESNAEYGRALNVFQSFEHKSKPIDF